MSKNEYRYSRTVELHNIPFANYDPATETLKFDIPITPLDDETMQLLERTFPHTMMQVDRLFSIEALIACYSARKEG